MICLRETPRAPRAMLKIPHPTFGASAYACHSEELSDGPDSIGVVPGFSMAAWTHYPISLAALGVTYSRVLLWQDPPLGKGGEGEFFPVRGEPFDGVAEIRESPLRDNLAYRQEAAAVWNTVGFSTWVFRASRASWTICLRNSFSPSGEQLGSPTG